MPEKQQNERAARLKIRVQKLREGLRDVQGYLRHEFRGLHLGRIDDILEADDELAAPTPPTRNERKA